jgi:hypothetical protein
MFRVLLPMPDFLQTIQQHTDLPVEKQVQAGKSAGSPMDREHENFMRTILKMIDQKEIDLARPESFLKMEVYSALDEEWKAKVDVALVNISDLLSHIVAFRISKKTPDESPELQSMIEHLWQMKQRIEETHDVFKF